MRWQKTTPPTTRAAKAPARWEVEVDGGAPASGASGGEEGNARGRAAAASAELKNGAFWFITTYAWG